VSVPGIFVDKTLLMRRPRRTGAAAPQAAFRVVEVDDVEGILSHGHQAGRDSEAERVRQRRRHGLRFFSLLEHDTVVANTWAVRGGARFLDEAMLVLQLAPDAACLRDVFVRPADRGRGIFRQLVESLEHGPLDGISDLWSCVEAGNLASIAAHRRAAFAPAGEVSTVALFDRLMWRRPSLPDALECRDYDASRHWLWMDDRARAFRCSQLA
jgi:GNAT superfamily N-acetyltransferase